MPATHKLQITLDEAAGSLTGTHRCTVALGGLSVGYAREVELPPEVAGALKAFIDGNREQVESEAVVAAIQHAAALSDKKQPGVTPLKVGGSLGALGGSEVKKVE